MLKDVLLYRGVKQQCCHGFRCPVCVMGFWGVKVYAMQLQQVACQNVSVYIYTYIYARIRNAFPLFGSVIGEGGADSCWHFLT